jgi:hypothetical protein
MATAPLDTVRARAERIVATTGAGTGARVVDTSCIPGAGSTPGAAIPSAGIEINGDRLADLRSLRPPVIGRREGTGTVLDMRSVSPADDDLIVAALVALDTP